MTALSDISPARDTAPVRFEATYAAAMPGTYVKQAPDVAPDPGLVILNEDLGASLGYDRAELRANAAAWFSGAKVPTGSDPIALAYAGHQFGGFSPQLGDGRAHLLGEIVTPDGARVDLQLKGSGRTPFSRGGDGKAALAPMLREYLVSEAMHALGVPTTRSLAVTTTGERVWREAGGLTGAVVARVAASHIRVGTFQYLAARGDTGRLRALVQYTLARHYPDHATDANPAVALFDAVAGRQTRLIAQWMGLGFVHGVMNTDNMALSGETIDYGPCAFMEAYAPGTVFSSIDHQGRYAYANQPLILGWNLARLAETLLPLIDADGETAVGIANDRLGRIAPAYRAAWTDILRAKLGLDGQDEADFDLAEAFLAAMAGQGSDWTLTFRALGRAAAGDETGLRAQFADPAALDAWLPRWRARLAPGAGAAMDRVNPAVIPRNHLVEAALAAAEEGDLGPFRALLAEVTRPFAATAGREAYALPAPSGFGAYVTYCGT